MRRLLFFFSILSVYSANILKNPYIEDGRYFLFPGDGDGLLHLVDSQEPVDENLIFELTRHKNNGYWLYTRQNPNKADILLYEDTESIWKSNFDLKKTTVFTVHGWLGSGSNDMNKMLTEAFLEDDDVNVIVLDWYKLANKNYVTAKNGCSELGKQLGQFIQWLVALGASYNRIHLVGFSLGGHVVANAGRHTDSLVRRITALDPAGPLWKNDENRLTNLDAQYVEVIHTSSLYGYTDPCGHADFYPNGGSSMPGCWINVCSHSKGYEYMALSVKYNQLYANECDTLKEATRGHCTGDLYPMGNSDLTKSRSGIFHVDTKSNV